MGIEWGCPAGSLQQIVERGKVVIHRDPGFFIRNIRE